MRAKISRKKISASQSIYIDIYIDIKWSLGFTVLDSKLTGVIIFCSCANRNIQGGPNVGIRLLNYFLCALKLPAVHFMWPKSRHTVNGENYLEILCEVVVPQLQTKPNFDELFFQQDGTSPHYALRVRDYLNKVFTQRWFGRTGSIEWPPCSPDLTPMDFFFWGVVKNKEYVKNKEKNPKTVNELKDCIYDAFREIDAN